VEVTYSYWDGTGHRKSVKVKKGTTIAQFLETCRRDLIEVLQFCDNELYYFHYAQGFHELRALSAENLMYIKEDLIIPHHYSFYDLIVTKARGKSGPLFHFDVHDDIRLVRQRCYSLIYNSFNISNILQGCEREGRKRRVARWKNCHALVL
jgi:protein FAM50